MPFFRWWRGDEATITFLQTLTRPDDSGGFVGALIGQRLMADPRVRALYTRLNLAQPDAPPP